MSIKECVDGYYKGIKVTVDNEDDLFEEFNEEVTKEYKYKFECLKFGISSLDENLYLIEVTKKMMKEIDAIIEDDEIYESKRLLNCIKSNIEYLQSELSFKHMLYRVNEMIRIINLEPPISQGEDEE